MGDGAKLQQQAHRRHWRQIYLAMFIGLPILSGLFLYLEHVTHYEFLLHAAAIPLEILLGAFLVERFLGWKERQGKLQQLMYIKSYLFRSELRNVYLTNFEALEAPRITMEQVAAADLEELHRIRRLVQQVQYKGSKYTEPIVMAYVQSQRIFQMFLEWAISNDIENIFHDMVNVLHFIQDVRLFKERHPNQMFMEELEDDPDMAGRVYQIFHGGLHKFLDYVIELKEKQPEVFEEIMDDYCLSARIRPAGTPRTPSENTEGETKTETETETEGKSKPTTLPDLQITPRP